MRCFISVVIGLLLMSHSLIAQESLQEKLDELDHIGFGWIYDNFDQAKAEAKERNQPIFALFRWVPWEVCLSFDGQVVRQNSELADLVGQFVKVRLVHMRDIDLAQFQFDYDLTWAVVFLILMVLSMGVMVHGRPKVQWLIIRYHRWRRPWNGY